MINAIVIDDEWYNLEEISDLIENTGFMKVAKKYQNPVKALEEVLVVKPEVAFIDIEMPEIDGLELAEKILEQNPAIIIAFITSWNKYAVQAFDLNAIDYIMKPIKIERFNRMVDKIKNEMEIRKSNKSKELSIKCFDKLVTSVGEIPIKWERAKAEEVFAYLIMNHGCYVHKDTIIHNLWPEYEPVKALQILQTSICRIRNIFSALSKEVMLDYSGSKYCMVISNAECDFFEIEDALRAFNIEDENTYIKIEKALLMYRKGFLVQQGYLWSIEKDVELKKQFIQTMNDIVQFYSVQNQQNELCKYLKHLSMLTPYDDNVNYRLIRTLLERGEINDAFHHYEWLKDVLKEEYDTIPSKTIEDLLSQNSST